ncbi:MAG: MTH1187 family thiamine-binding protein [Nitrospirota bacterium]|nr:MTH1187 family thiamine-binding protein [Nitrospirota bacterium]
MMAEFSIVPLGKGASVSAVIARVMKVIIDSGIRYKANPMGTVLEGDWALVMGVIKRCHDEAMKDADRVVTAIKIDDYQGRECRLDAKLESVEQKLGQKLNK